MAKSSATQLSARPRAVEGSRSTRRLRREGKVPGIVYGGDGQPVPFEVDARELRHALAASGAVIELAIDGETDSVVVKDVQSHPVRGETMHIDLLRVRLDVAIQATVVLHVHGGEEAPGVKEGGVLEQVARELTVEALPNEIPEELVVEVGDMQINDTLTLEALTVPPNVKIVDDPETVLVTLTPPRLVVEDEDEIETETELVGEETPEGAAAEEAGGESPAEGGDEGGGE